MVPNGQMLFPLWLLNGGWLLGDSPTITLIITLDILERVMPPHPRRGVKYLFEETVVGEFAKVGEGSKKCCEMGQVQDTSLPPTVLHLYIINKAILKNVMSLLQCCLLQWKSNSQMTKPFLIGEVLQTPKHLGFFPFYFVQLCSILLRYTTRTAHSFLNDAVSNLYYH